MLYGSEIWNLGQNEMEIFAKNQKSYNENHVSMKLVEKKLTKDIMQMLDMKIK